MCISRTASRPAFLLHGCVLRQQGISLVELIMFIAIVSVGLAGLALALNQATSHSADTLVRKQAMAVAASLLEEIEVHTHSGGTCTGMLGANSARTAAHSVCDYGGYYTTSGVLDINGAAVSGLGGYNVAPAVSVAWVAPAWGNVPAGSAVAITVHVTDPMGNTYDATGYRTAY